MHNNFPRIPSQPSRKRRTIRHGWQYQPSRYLLATQLRSAQVMPNSIQTSQPATTKRKLTFMPNIEQGVYAAGVLRLPLLLQLLSRGLITVLRRSTQSRKALMERCVLKYALGLLVSAGCCVINALCGMPLATTCAGLICILTVFIRKNVFYLICVSKEFKTKCLKCARTHTYACTNGDKYSVKCSLKLVTA